MRVLILGGGYAGVMAANRLAARDDERMSVVLVNVRPYFVERIRLHEVAAGSRHDARLGFTEILHPNVEVLVGTAEHIVTDDRVMQGSSATGPWSQAYDRLVYAVGSAVPAADATVQLSTEEGAAQTYERLTQLPDAATVTVVGGGLTGIEAAAEIASVRGDLNTRLISAGLIGAALSERGRHSVLRALQRRRIDTAEQQRVTSVRPGGLTTDGSGYLDSDLILWSGGFAAPDLAARSGLPVDELGRLRVDRELRCIEDQTIFGAGDSVVTPLEHLRMSCAAAMPQGAHVADTITADLEAKQSSELSLGFVGQCIYLGKGSGVIQLVRRDDRPRKLVLSGKTGSWINEQVNNYTVTSMRRERRRAGAYKWLAGPPQKHHPVTADHDHR